MPITGLDPEKARDLSTTMRQDAVAADGLADTVTAALTLCELTSTVPGQLLDIGDELDQVGIIIAARADIAEGFVLDPAALAQELGLTVEQVEGALAAFDDPETDLDARSPLIDLLVAQKAAAGALRSSFVNLPPPGEDPAIDDLFERLALWLPDALGEGALPDAGLTPEQIDDLLELAVLLGVVTAEEAAAAVEADPSISGFAGAVAVALTSSPEALFDRVAEIHELDGRLGSAAGLPTVLDIYDHFDNTVGDPWDRPEQFAELDEWLPAFLIGQGEIPEDDPRAWYLATLLAVRLGFDPGPGFEPGAGFQGQSEAVQRQKAEAALDFLRAGRFLQKSLIPGDFEGVPGPVIPWTEGGIESALLAGRHNGVLNDQTKAVADAVAEAVLGAGDGADGPIELDEEQQQALVAAIVAQNGEQFVVDSPEIQRQIVAALNLIANQPTLADQKRVFADTIEAFRSLAVVGSPAVTWRQLQDAVGPEVVEEIGFSKLTTGRPRASPSTPSTSPCSSTGASPAARS